MKQELIFTAKSVEEARKKAAAELNAREEDLLITVLEEGKRGFLGIGAVDAKIAVSYTAAETAPKTAPKGEKSTEGVAAAMQFIRQVAENMGLDKLTYATEDGANDDTVLKVNGDDAGLLIGHHGETLDALQYLCNLAANRRIDGEKHAYTRITLDVEDYRQKREAALRALARRKAEKVLREKRSVMLEPMNPYERRIIHSAVQEIEGVTTNSIGVENNRRVVILLEENTTDAE